MLEKAGLIARSREAQWRPCKLEGARLKEVADWVERYRRFWEQSFDRLHEHFFDMAARDGHEFGWTGSMEKLSRFLQQCTQ